MRRIASLSFVLALTGCGYNTWWNPPFTGGYNPNKRQVDAVNMARVTGSQTDVEPLTVQSGNIWPGPLPPTPTLQDVEKDSSLTAEPQGPVPGSPLQRGGTGLSLSPNPSAGSSSPPAPNQPGMAMPAPSGPKAGYAAPPAPPPAPVPGGQALQTPGGQGVITGGGPGYRTAIEPGGQSIIVPNGNGTSTVIHPNGAIETVPTPK